MRNLSTKNKEGGATKEVPKDSSASTSTGKDSSSGNSKFIWWGLPIATIIPVIYYALNGNDDNSQKDKEEYTLPNTDTTIIDSDKVEKTSVVEEGDTTVSNMKADIGRETETETVTNSATESNISTNTKEEETTTKSSSDNCPSENDSCKYDASEDSKNLNQTLGYLNEKVLDSTDNTKSTAPAASIPLVPEPTVTVNVTEIPSPALDRVPSELVAEEMRSEASTVAIDELVMQIAGNHAEIEGQFIEGLGELDKKGLRTRIAQLTAEALERSKWAPVRKSQALRKLSADISEKYTSLLSQQRRELENEAARVSVAMKDALVQRSEQESTVLRAQAEAVTARALNEQATTMNSAALRMRETQRINMSKAYSAQLLEEVSSMRERHLEQMIELLSNAEVQLEQLGKLSGSMEKNKKNITDKGRNYGIEHKRLVAVLKADSVFEGGEGSSHDVKSTIDALKAAYEGDDLVGNVLSALPSSVTEGDTVLASTEELRSRLDLVRDEVMKKTLAPEAAPSMLGYAIGTILYQFMTIRQGMVEGDRPEERFARARHHIDHGCLVDAVEELSKLNSNGSELAQSWIQDAKTRIAFDQARRIIRSKEV